MVAFGLAGVALLAFGPRLLPEKGPLLAYVGSMAIIGALCGLFAVCCWPRAQSD